jgi:hypothetical protein
MPTTTAPKQAPAKAAGDSPKIKKLSLGGIATKSASKTKTAYPVLPDPSGDTAKLVADILSETAELEAISGSLDIKKAELRGAAQEFYFEHYQGKHDIASSIEAHATNGDAVLVSFQSRYKAIPDESPIIETIGEDRTARFFRQSFELKVDGDKIPEASAEDLIAELQELFARFNATDALSAKSVIKPTSDFHTARHTALSVDENRAVDLVCPIVAAVKTKGRKKD